MVMAEKEEPVAVEREWKDVKRLFVLFPFVTVDSDVIHLSSGDYVSATCLRCYASGGGFPPALGFYLSSEEPLTCRLLKKGERREFVCEPA